MAKVGIKCLTWAKYSAGGDGAAVTYTGGQMLQDYMVQGEISVDTSDGREYADDHMIDTETAPTAVHLSMELANMSDAMLADFCGMKSGGTGANAEYSLTDEGSPYIGCGFMMVNRYKGTVTYEGVWIYKIQFRRESLSASTKTDSVDFGHENVTGDGVGVQLASGGDTVFFVQKTGGANAAAIETWLRGKAGIS